MSGFLHRLAAQAMGSTNTLRSAARLSYAASPSPVNREEPGEQAATLDITVNERHPVANRGAEWDPVFSQEQHHVNTYREIDAQSGDNKVTPSSPEVLIAQTAIGSAAKPDRPSGQSSSVKAVPRQSSIKKIVADEPPVLVEGFEMRIALNNSTALADSVTPPPLLPLSKPVHPSALNASGVARHGEPRGFAWQGQVEETTEVHVNIGRIEVTAVHESPPPKRQAPTSAKPLSLDEYLARRGRGT